MIRMYWTLTLFTPRSIINVIGICYLKQQQQPTFFSFECRCCRRNFWNGYRSKARHHKMFKGQRCRWTAGSGGCTGVRGACPPHLVSLSRRVPLKSWSAGGIDATSRGPSLHRGGDRIQNHFSDTKLLHCATLPFLLISPKVIMTTSWKTNISVATKLWEWLPRLLFPSLAQDGFQRGGNRWPVDKLQQEIDHLAVGHQQSGSTKKGMEKWTYLFTFFF